MKKGADSRVVIRELIHSDSTNSKTLQIYRNFICCMDQASIHAKELARRAIVDELTSLCNGRAFKEILPTELEQSVRAGQPLSVMLLDLDNLKHWNETGTRDYGRGDLALTALADQLRPFLREGDVTYAFRKHGDEFALILPGMPLLVAAKRASDICAGIAKQELRYRGEAMPAATISIGVSGYPAHGRTYRQLIDAASRALGQAKCNRNTTVVASEQRRSGVGAKSV